MTRTVLLAVILVATVSLAAEETPPPLAPPVPGIYGADTLLCPLAELSQAAVLGRPDPDDAGLPALPDGVTVLRVVAPPEEARRLGVRPGALRLVRKQAEVDRYPYRVVAASVARTQADQHSFRLVLGAPLAPGSYRFGLERPELEAGTDLQTVIRFLPCGFVVPALAASE